MGRRITLTIIKADVGGFVSHSSVHPELMETAQGILAGSALLTDFHVTHVGDDINLIMTHEGGKDNGEVHQLAWDTFSACTRIAKKLKLYGAGQDLLADAFSGNIKGLGPGVAEIEFEERTSEPVIVFMADKTEPGAWNLPVYKMFADPSYDLARQKANEIASYMRGMGPFKSHRLHLEEMEYTTMPEVSKHLKDRFEKLR